MLKITIDQMYDYLSDLFESVAWSDSTLTEIGNSLIAQIAFECRPETVRRAKENQTYDSRRVIEAMLNALVTLVSCHDVAHRLNFAPVLPHIETFDCSAAEQLLTALACTGDLQYEALIGQTAGRFPALLADEYLTELRKYAAYRQSHAADPQ